MTIHPHSNSPASLFLTPSTRHHALATRDPLAHSAFIYAVITTRIYCRPTCPSRLARRSNVVFYDTPTQASAAGFRACKRCKPDDGGLETGDWSGWGEMVGRVMGLVEGEGMGGMKGVDRIVGGGMGKKWSVKELAREVGLTESHFCRVFKKVSGMTVGEYRNSLPETKHDGGHEKVVHHDDSANGPGDAHPTQEIRLQGPERKQISTSEELCTTWVCYGNEGGRDNACLRLDGFGRESECSDLAGHEDLREEDWLQFLDFGSLVPVQIAP